MTKVVLAATAILLFQLCSAFVVPGGVVTTNIKVSPSGGGVVPSGGVQTVYVHCPQYPCPKGSFCVTGTPQGNICQQLTWIANHQDYVKQYFTKDDFSRYRQQVKQDEPGLLEKIDRGVFGGFFGRFGFLNRFGGK